ncbi:hypothetical protein [Streptomyces canus]|uniref:hypothetical protein n=1 Tax=Streptomyces canus TaxID=58343 RepID=UPI002DDAEEC4|nr:hypothetical protein [Streptomyces canus]WSD86990.1 hypothetical protein OG925_22980 [Streptomyces canus]
MTTAILSRTASRRRAGLAAAGLVGALVLTACSGGGSDDEPSPNSSTAGSSSSASASASGGTGGTSSSSASGEVAGNWLATTSGKAVALLVNGDRAGLFVTGGTVCSGSASADAIRLKCTDGSKDRADGTIESVGKDTLKVNWEGGIGAETYTRATGGTLPSGFPSVGSGS